MTNPNDVTNLLGKVADKVLGSPLEGGLEKVQGAHARAAYVQALGAAIQRYATGDKLAVAEPLLRPNGFLVGDDAVVVLARMIHPGHIETDAQLFGKQWQAQFVEPLASVNFTEEAQRLLASLETELKLTGVFRLSAEGASVEGAAAANAPATEDPHALPEMLANLTDLSLSAFGRMTGVFIESPPAIRSEIRSYTRLIEEKTRDFVGRKFVFEALEGFMSQGPKGGYFIIRGDPGIGKSALAAQMVRTGGHVHHFNIRAEGINKADIFLRNVCAQLIAAHRLPYSALPAEAAHDGRFLSQLLEKVSGRLGDGGRAVVVVDGLDEVDSPETSENPNPLNLPLSLPAGVFFVLTTRKLSVKYPFETARPPLDIEQDSDGNVQDVFEYVEQAAGRPGIQAYITSQKLTREQFVADLVVKSQGNFMYLRYVLPEIEKGRYQALRPEELPLGLQAYYEDHWQRMQGVAAQSWFERKLPVLMALTVVKEPVSVELIADFSGIEDRAAIREVIYEWQQFLHEEPVEYEGGRQLRYRIYHASFHDFIVRKEEVGEELVSRKAAHARIADNLWSELFGNE